MKKLILLCAVVTLIASCNTKEYQDQRCYGLLMDSLTRLSKFRDRVHTLEKDATTMANDYQAKIESLEKKVDSLNQRIHNPVHHKKGKKCVVKVVKMAKPIAQIRDGHRPFFYENNSQKYFFYDSDRKTYYNIDPVSRERRYVMR